MAKENYFTKDFKDFLGKRLEMYDIAINMDDYSGCLFFIILGNTTSDAVRGLRLDILNKSVPYRPDYSNRYFRNTEKQLVVVTDIPEFQQKLSEVLKYMGFSNKEELWEHLKGN